MMRRMRYGAVMFGLVLAACGMRQSGQPADAAVPPAAPGGTAQNAAATAPAVPGGQPAEQVAFNRADFEAFLAEVRSEALQKGIKADVVNTALAGVEPVMRIIERDRNQAEFKLTFSTYRDRVITPANVSRGQKLREEQQALLRQVAQR